MGRGQETGPSGQKALVGLPTRIHSAYQVARGGFASGQKKLWPVSRPRQQRETILLIRT
jgi:hypothetical protein